MDDKITITVERFDMQMAILAMEYCKGLNQAIIDSRVNIEAAIAEADKPKPLGKFHPIITIRDSDDSETD